MLRSQGFENMPFKNFSLSKPCDILRFVKAIDDENFKICLDTGHVAVFEGMSRMLVKISEEIINKSK